MAGVDGGERRGQQDADDEDHDAGDARRDEPVILHDVLLAQGLSITRPVPPLVRVPQVVGRIDWCTAYGTKLCEPALLLLGVALALLAATAGLQPGAEPPADRRAGDYQQDRAAGEQRDVNAEHVPRFPVTA